MSFFFDHYPYTNFHNVNLDWVLEAVKAWGRLVEENNIKFHNLEEAMNSFRNTLLGEWGEFKDDTENEINQFEIWTQNYLQNLDIQDEINTKLDSMLSSGVLSPYFAPYIQTDVSDWLQHNITPTSPAIDASLTISGAGADAAETGKRINVLSNNLIANNFQTSYFTGVLLTMWEQGGLYASSGLPYNTQSAIRTDYISVNTNEKIHIYNTNNIVWRIFAYNNNYEFVRSASPAHTDAQEGSYDVPENISYLRIQLSITDSTINTSSANGFVLIKSNSYILDYTNETYANKNKVELNTTQISSFSGVIFCEWEQGGLYVSSGLPYNTQSAIRTDFISCEGVNNFVFNNPKDRTWRIFAYDSNKDFVQSASPVHTDAKEGEYKVNEGVSYIRVQLSIPNSTITTNEALYFMIATDDSYIINFTKSYASRYQREVSILFVGNSLTQDGIAYLPYMLKTYYPEISFKFYMWYNGGYTLAQQYSKFTNNETCAIFSVAENSATWTNYSNSKTMSEILANYTFDIVCLQEYFNGKSSYTDADLSDWNNCKNYIEANYQGGNGLEFISLFHAPKRDSSETVFNLTKTGNALILKNTIAEDMIPNGIAVYRALSSSLDSLGDEGHLSPDGIHTQEGLPCLLQTYVTLCWLFDKLAINKSVYGCHMRMTTAIYNTINVPGANLGTGVITGTDAENLLAQEIAIKAYKEGKWLVLNNIYSES